LSKTDHSTHCPWKGDAAYYNINLDSELHLGVRRRIDVDEMPETELKNAAWYYPEPKDGAKNIKDYVAFCKLSTDLTPSNLATRNRVAGN
jgi:uncharacterized protein (DUF427 family)